METHKTSLIILLLIFIFALIHSGGAALRIKAESIMGPRLWRLCFVLLSLPSAIILISYFLAHRYDGIRLWNFQGNNFVFVILKEVCLIIISLAFRGFQNFFYNIRVDYSDLSIINIGNLKQGP